LKKESYKMNNVTLIGRIVREVELKFTPGAGTAVATLTLAVDKYSKDGEKAADFIPVVIWGKQAENTASYTSKGSLIAVSGRISTRSYEAKDGTKRYVTEVVANEVKFLDGKKKEETAANNTGFDDDMTPVNDGDIPF
jgi:single-strand DNA-binding protein